MANRDYQYDVGDLAGDITFAASGTAISNAVVVTFDDTEITTREKFLEALEQIKYRVLQKDDFPEATS